MYLQKIIQKNKHKFSKSEEELAKYFMHNEQKLVTMTIASISSETSISQTTIFNFVKKLGFKGFQEFKISLASNLTSGDNPITVFENVTSDDTNIEIAQKIVSFHTDSLTAMLQSIDLSNLDKVMKLIEDSENLYFFGQGGSSVVAFDAFHKFLRTDYHCNYFFDYHIQLSYATKLNDSDCVFLFSHSGDSVETINLASTLNKNNAKIIVLTGNPVSPLIDLADESIIIYTDEVKYRTEALNSRLLYLSVMDILYTITVVRNEKANVDVIQRIRKALKFSKN